MYRTLSTVSPHHFPEARDRVRTAHAVYELATAWLSLNRHVLEISLKIPRLIIFLIWFAKKNCGFFFIILDFGTPKWTWTLKVSHPLKNISSGSRWNPRLDAPDSSVAQSLHDILTSDSVESHQQNATSWKSFLWNRKWFRNFIKILACFSEILVTSGKPTLLRLPRNPISCPHEATGHSVANRCDLVEEVHILKKDAVDRNHSNQLQLDVHGNLPETMAPFLAPNLIYIYIYRFHCGFHWFPVRFPKV